MKKTTKKTASAPATGSGAGKTKTHWVMPEQIEYPVICSKCLRKSPTWKDRLRKCNLTQPDGTKCQGVFLPRNAVREYMT